MDTLKTGLNVSVAPQPSPPTHLDSLVSPHAPLSCAVSLCPTRPTKAGLKNTPQSKLLMSTFEGRQITQLICPKPTPTSPTTTISTPHGSPSLDAKNTGGESDSTVVDGDSEAGEGSSKTRGGGDGEGASGNAEESTEIAETGFDTRERGEAFMCISLEVKNMVGVEDALKKLTEKEIIEGYAWDDGVR